jgi:polygalacturonase
VDPECSENVIIEHALFLTGDDPVAIKGLRNRDGLDKVIDRGGIRRQFPQTRNIVIRNIEISAVPGAENKLGLGGIAVGSEISAGCDNVWLYNISVSYRMRGIYFKTNTKRGGAVTNVHISNIVLRHIRTEAIRFSMDYHPSWSSDLEEGHQRPAFANITLSNIWMGGVTTGLYLTKAKNSVLDIRMNDLHFARTNVIMSANDLVNISSSVDMQEYKKQPVQISPLQDFQYRPPLDIQWIQVTGI